MLSERLQDPKAYWAHHRLPLEADVDVARVLEAWETVAVGTEALRAGFVPAAQVVDGYAEDAQHP
jgi:ferricrocin synthase